jgi:ferrous iron transport protein A
MRLDQLPLRQPRPIAAVDWEALPPRDAKRLRELGFDTGLEVEALHRGAWSGPIACRVGRMTVALRRAHAAAITVQTA